GLVQSRSGDKERAPAFAAKDFGRPGVIAIRCFGDTDDRGGPPKAFKQMSAEAGLVLCPEPDIAVNDEHRRPEFKPINQGSQQRQFAFVEAARLVLCRGTRDAHADFGRRLWCLPAVCQHASRACRFGSVGGVEKRDNAHSSTLARSMAASWHGTSLIPPLG